MKILVLDHEDLLHTTIEFKLQKAGMSPIFLDSITGIQKSLDDNDIAVGIADLDIEGNDAVDFLRVCKENSIPLLGITNMEDEGLALQWFEDGVSDFIAKPYKTSEIIVRIQKVLLAKAIH